MQYQVDIAAPDSSMVPTKGGFILSCVATMLALCGCRLSIGSSRYVVAPTGGEGGDEGEGEAEGEGEGEGEGEVAPTVSLRQMSTQSVREGITVDFEAWKHAIDLREEVIGQRFVPPPRGESYDAAVPDTLDLAERARLAVNCLTGALDPDYGYELYFVVRFNADPPFMHHEASGLPTNNPKFAEALPMMRAMSGSTQNLEIERGMLKRMLALVADDGLYYAPLIGRPWHHTWHRADEDFANVYGNARFLLAMMAWREYDGNPMWDEYIRNMIAGLRKIAVFKDDYAYFVDPKIGESFSYPKSGYQGEQTEPSDPSFSTHMYHSGVVQALAKWYRLTGDADALDLAGKLANFMRKPKFWVPETSPASIVAGERGHFQGQFHSHTAMLLGLLEYADAANDAGLKTFVRDGYEYARNFGVARIGWFPENTPRDKPDGTPLQSPCESCCTADMVCLAVKLSVAGVGEYWEDVDRYVRNQLIEQQFVRKDLLENVAASSAPHDAHPPNETADRVIERNLGGWAGHGDLTQLPNAWIMHCCTGNAARSLYYAWHNIVREQSDGAVQVNLLLNRASPCMDIDSYLPYEGKVVLHNKTAKRVFVRIPLWVSRPDVHCMIGSETYAPVRHNNYLLIERLGTDAEIAITFPIVAAECTRTLWDTTYTLQLRGNTVIDVSPRVHNDQAYPIYQRDAMNSGEAPIVQRARYVLDRYINE